MKCAFVFLVSATVLGGIQVEAGCGTPDKATTWCQEQGYEGAKTKAQCNTVEWNDANCNYGSYEECGCFSQSGFNWYNGGSSCKTPTSTSRTCINKQTCDVSTVTNCFCGGTASQNLCKDGKECLNSVCEDASVADSGTTATTTTTTTAAPVGCLSGYGGSPCVACDAGKYSSGAGCTDCDAGEYQDQAGQASCEVCDKVVTADKQGCIGITKDWLLAEYKKIVQC